METKQEFKTFSLAIDMVRTIGQPPFEVVWGDTGNLLLVTLTNDGVPVDLAGAYVCVVFRSSIGTALQDETNGLTLSDNAGEFTLRLLAESYGAGDVSADIQVYTGEDRETLITSRRFTFRCRNALLNDKTMQANGTYPPLISATHAATEAAKIALEAAKRNGDMYMERYDPNGDGIVAAADRAATADTAANAANAANADKLGGQAPSYYAAAAALAQEISERKAIVPATIGAAKKSTISSATLEAAAWEGDTAPYMLTLPLAGITQTAAVELLPEVSITQEQLEALQNANLQDGGQAADSITIAAFGDKPEMDLPIRIIVRGDL